MLCGFEEYVQCGILLDYYSGMFKRYYLYPFRGWVLIAR